MNKFFLKIWVFFFSIFLGGIFLGACSSSVFPCQGSGFEKVAPGFMKDQKTVCVYGTKIKGADPVTFEVLKFRIPEYAVFSKDKNHVYLNEKILQSEKTGKNIDAESFSMLDHNYFLDKNAVYTLSYGAGQFTKLHTHDHIDSQTFELLKGGYTRDKNTVYWRTKPLEGVDEKNFQVFDNALASDGKKIFQLGREIPQEEWDKYIDQIK